MREFIYQTRMWGFRTAVNNWLIGFTKWFIDAKRIQISYKKKLTQKQAGRHVIVEDKSDLLTKLNEDSHD